MAFRHKVSIEEIFDFLGDRRDFNICRSDIKTKKAVERNLEIIGEAMSRILKVELKISTSYLSAGVYIITLQTHSRGSQSLKIVKDE